MFRKPSRHRRDRNHLPAEKRVDRWLKGPEKEKTTTKKKNRLSELAMSFLIYFFFEEGLESSSSSARCELSDFTRLQSLATLRSHQCHHKQACKPPAFFFFFFINVLTHSVLFFPSQKPITNRQVLPVRKHTWLTEIHLVGS